MEKMRDALPATANLKNPVDVIGDARADRYTAALEAVLEDPNIDQTLVILTPQSMTDIESIARGICKFHETADEADRLLVHGRGRRGAGHPAACSRPTSPTTSCPNGPARRWPTCSASASGAQQPMVEFEPLPVDRQAAQAIIDKQPRAAISTRIGPWPCWRPTACRCRSTSFAERRTRPWPSPTRSAIRWCCGWSARRSSTSRRCKASP